MKKKILKIFIMIIMIALVIFNMTSIFATDTEEQQEEPVENETIVQDPEPEEPKEPEQPEEPEEPKEEPKDEPQNNVEENPIENEVEPKEENVVDQNTVDNTEENNKSNTIAENVVSNTVNTSSENNSSSDTMEIDPKKSEEQVNQAINYATKAQKLDLEGKGLKSLVIYGYDEANEQYILAISPDFNTNVYNYRIQAGINIKNIKLEYELIDEDGVVENFGKTELEAGVNFLTIIARNADFTENVTYQISINKLDESVLPTYDGLNENAKELTIKSIILYASIAILTVSTILFVILEFILGKKDKATEDFRDRNKMNVQSILEDVEKKDEEEKPKSVKQETSNNSSKIDSTSTEKEKATKTTTNNKRKKSKGKH